MLPLTEATSATKASEEAAEVVNSTISSARTFIATKNLEVKHFGAAASKPAIQEFAQLTEKINSAASRRATGNCSLTLIGVVRDAHPNTGPSVSTRYVAKSFRVALLLRPRARAPRRPESVSGGV